MRRLLLLTIVSAACSTAGSDTTTTTALPAEPSTATTTTTETTTTPEDECVEQDGVLRDRRGFVCPPYLTSAIDAQPSGYRPGTYATRLFQPPLRFTHEVRFRSHGEMPVLVVIDHRGSTPLLPSRGIGAISGSATEFLFGVADRTPRQHGDDWDWAIEETATQWSEVGGHPARRTEFITRCWDGVSDPSRISNLQCSFSLPTSGLPGGSWTYLDGQHVVQFLVEVPGDQVLLEIRADVEDADRYWADVAQPVLDSIEFLDP